MQDTAHGNDPDPSRTIDWLLTGGHQTTSIATLLEAYGHHLRAVGCQVDRMTLHVRLLHPQIRAVTYIWRVGADGVEQLNRQHGIEVTADFRTSPIYALVEEGVEGIHVPIGRTAGPYPYPVLDDLKAQGFSDYAAMPMVFSSGRRNVITFATRRQDGFTTAELAVLYAALPAFTVLLEARMLRLLATNLLNTYVGPNAGIRILNGDIRRGSGLTISAALWFCDLRGFTALADRLEIGPLIDLLNDYFDVMGGAVQRRGGEILKFVGDAMLAIFPIDPQADGQDRDAKARLALAAAEDAMKGMAALNAAHAATGQPRLGAGIALHVGDVMYGNIGAADRLDFTVIGPAVNLVTRLETVTRTLERPLLTSAAFAQACVDPRLRALGRHPVKGMEEPVEVFGLG